jgi:hypothetical protein
MNNKPNNDHIAAASGSAPAEAAATESVAGNLGDSASSQPAAIDPATLKAAYVAFKKRWKLTRLDYESRIGKSPLSSGNRNTIVGIEAPREYPKAVWEELVKQGRLKHAGSGLYSMP